VVSGKGGQKRRCEGGGGGGGGRGAGVRRALARGRGGGGGMLKVLNSVIMCLQSVSCWEVTPST